MLRRGPTFGPRDFRSLPQPARDGGTPATLRIARPSDPYQIVLVTTTKIDVLVGEEHDASVVDADQDFRLSPERHGKRLQTRVIWLSLPRCRKAWIDKDRQAIDRAVLPCQHHLCGGRLPFRAEIGALQPRAMKSPTRSGPCLINLAAALSWRAMGTPPRLGFIELGNSEQLAAEGARSALPIGTPGAVCHGSVSRQFEPAPTLTRGTHATCAT
jgi:hypothetical protein